MSQLSDRTSLAIISAGITVITIVYSYFAYLRYVTYNSYVFDLGVSSQLLYGVLHGSGIQLNNLAINKLIYIPMGVIYGIHPYPPSLEYFQAFWLSLGSLPIYFIARRRLENRNWAMAISISYLAYYPLGGVYWFDFHFMALFPTLFLMAIMLRDGGRNRSSIFIAVLAGLTDFLAPLFLVFYAIYLLVERRKENRAASSTYSYELAVLVAGILIFIMVMAYYGMPYFLNYANGSITVPAPFSHNSPPVYRAEYFLWMLLPVLFSSLLAPSALLMLVPYVGFALVNQYTPYVSTMFYQYPALVAPLIFYTAICGLGRLKKLKIGNARRFTRSIGGFIYSVLFFNIVLALLFTPAGSLLTGNLSSQHVEYYLTGQNGGYYVENILSYHTYDSNISALAGLIPPGSSVLIQNNMAQLTSRYNWTLPYMLNLSKGKLPEFVLVDPYNRAYYTSYFTTNIQMNMAYEASSLISLGLYGIYAESGGAVLLKYGYHGKPVLWKPAVILADGTIFQDRSGSGMRWDRIPITYNSNMFLPGGNDTIMVRINAANITEISLYQLIVEWKYSRYSSPEYLNFTITNTMDSNGTLTWSHEISVPYGPEPIFAVEITGNHLPSDPGDIYLSVIQESY